MALAMAAPENFQAFQDFSLQRRSETFHVLQPVGARGPLQVIEAADAKLFVKLEHPVGAQSWKIQHFQHAGWNLPAQSFQLGMRAAALQCSDPLRDGFADAGNLTQAVLRDEVFQRFGQRAQTLGGFGISAGAVWVFARKLHTAAKLHQESGDCGCVESFHWIAVLASTDLYSCSCLDPPVAGGALGATKMSDFSEASSNEVAKLPNDSLWPGRRLTPSTMRS